jgi:hypothetical protein
MFIQHLASEAQNMAKTERKPRRNIQYKDLGMLVYFIPRLTPKVHKLTPAVKPMP